jgi:hypothetical protein
MTAGESIVFVVDDDTAIRSAIMNLLESNLPLLFSSSSLVDANLFGELVPTLSAMTAATYSGFALLALG